MAVASESLLFDSAFLRKLEQLSLLARRIHQGAQHADRRSRHLGVSLEFADYRNYSFGDDLRKIDWNIYGRLDRLFVKLFEEEQDLHVHFLLDASASMQWQPGENADALCKFDQARRMAASLAYIGLAKLDRINIHLLTETGSTDLGFTRGRGQFHKILRFLEKAQPGGATDLTQSLERFARQQKRRGLVFFFSDLFDPAGFEKPLSVLRNHHFEVDVLQIVDPAELDPALRGDLRLSDCETGQYFDLTAQPALLKKYRAEIDRYLQDVEKFCRKSGFGFLRVTTAEPFEDLVLRVLRRERMLR